MKLSVHFKCSVTIHEFKRNYTGSITFNPEAGDSQTYYFLILNPYSGKDAEFSIFEDERMENTYADAIGTPKQGYNPHTGLPVTYYDLSHIQSEEKIGITYVLINIVSEAVYHAENEWHVRLEQPDKKVVQSHFSNIWKQDFREGTEKYARAFLKAFGMY
ncbi:MAG TPA: hypothetical protein VJH55_04025 [Candidatus Paceibacterota bacterium]